MAEDIDPGLAAILAHARARIDRPPEEGEEDVASFEPDAEVLKWAETAPPGLRELLQIAAKHMHVDLGLWEVWSGAFEGTERGVEVEGKLPKGFDPKQAIQIGGTSGGELSVLLTWTKERYTTWVWDLEESEITKVGDFTRLLDLVRERTNSDAYEDDTIEMVNESALPGLLAAAKLEAWSPG